MIVDEKQVLGIKDAKTRREMRNYMRFVALWPKHKARMVYRPRWYPYFGPSHEAAARFGSGRTAGPSL
jgi:hypothetical protein